MKVCFGSIFILFLILFTSTVFADSLEEGKSLFNQGTTFYQEGKYSKAYRALNEGIEIFQSEDQGVDEWLMNSYLWIGAASFQLMKYKEAEDYYLQSLILAEREKNYQYQSNIITALANLKFSLNDFSQAGDWYLKSADLLTKLKALDESRRAYEYGGYCKILAEEYDEAFVIIESSLEQSDKDRPQNEMAWLHAMRGNCLYYLNDLSEALRDYLLSVSKLEPFGSSSELTKYIGWIGKIYFDLGNNEKAIINFEKSLLMARELGGKEDESRVLAYFGFLYSSSGQYEKAANYYMESLEIAKTLENTEFLIAAYESLAWIYEETHKNEALIQINNKLIELFERTDHQIKLAGLLNEQAYLFYNRKEFDQAIPLFKKSLSIYGKFDNKDEMATVLLNLGMSYEKIGKKEESQIYLNESISLNLKEGNTLAAEELLGHFNLIYSEESDYYNLIKSLEKLIPLYRGEKQMTKLMHLTNNIGAIYYSIDEYEKAIENYKNAHVLAIQLNDAKEQCITLYNIAQSKAAIAHFNEALELNEKALKIAKEKGLNEIVGDLWNNIGELYRAWGAFEKSLSYYNSALKIFEERADLEGLASVHNNIGLSLRMSGEAEKSLSHFNLALSINSELDDDEARAINLNNIGETFRQMGDSKQALSHYTQALQIDINLKNLKGIHIRKNNIALLDLESGHHGKALEAFEQGLQYWQITGNKREEATAYKNIWSVYFNLEQYKTAADYLVEAVRLHEELRLTAQGAVRREFLESQVLTYRELAATYYFMDDPLNSLYYLELSRGKYLLEQMNISEENQAYDWSLYKAFINSLDNKTSLISYSFTDENLYQAVAVQKGKVTTTLIEIDELFLDEVYSQFSSLLRRYTEDSEEKSFETVLKLYRLLLARPIQSRTTIKAVDFIGKYLYSKLLLPFSKELKNTKQLIVVPDGILGTIPFEVLQDERGIYAVEKWDITYSQSLVISQIIREREYKKDRKPLLAFGGAVYEEDTYNDQVGETDVSVIRQNVSDMIRTGSSMRGAYTGMGHGNWKNLPGTLDEVNLLSTIVKGAEIITGENVTEELVRDKSNSGILASYKVIHFATHGIVIPELPELSAVVLSQLTDSKSKEDGYLTMNEIATLDIKADFVNLSACETGLGKIYQGEGVVGLTQAFLIAGAKALSVSLWQVSDESTMRFMTGVYSLVEEQNFTYSQANSEMKRVFLKDDKYKNPFYWAPFVLYGDFEAGQ